MEVNGLWTTDLVTTKKYSDVAKTVELISQPWSNLHVKSCEHKHGFSRFPVQIVI